MGCFNVSCRRIRESNKIKSNYKEKILSKIRIKNRFENLKESNVLQKIFDIISKKKSLLIVKYNKSLQQKLNLDFNDYKDFNEIYSSIEIEITPVQNKYGIFINYKEEEKNYYHIYFNNTKEEIKRNYLNEDDKISIINIFMFISKKNKFF